MFRDTNSVLNECHERYKTIRNELNSLKNNLREMCERINNQNSYENKGHIIEEWILNNEQLFLPEK